MSHGVDVPAGPSPENQSASSINSPPAAEPEMPNGSSARKGSADCLARAAGLSDDIVRNRAANEFLRSRAVAHLDDMLGAWAGIRSIADITDI